MLERAEEVEFLRYFYQNVMPALGPADGDITDSIKQSFKRTTGKALPEGYYDYEEEE